MFENFQSIKYRNKLQTIQSLYGSECKNHESARSDIRMLKQKLETLQTNLLGEKSAHLEKVTALEASANERDKLQSQLSHTEARLAEAVANWHSYESMCQLKNDRCAQLENEKEQLMKQVSLLNLK